MDEEDYELAFALYDRPKAKLVGPNVGFSSNFATAPTHSKSPHNPPLHASSLRQNAFGASTNTSTTSTAHRFRSSFSPPAVAKPTGAAPLNIVHSTPSSLISSNRSYILPAKSTHSRDPHSSVIRLDSTPMPSNHTSPTKSPMMVSRAQDEIGWFDDDDVLAPIPGISRETTAPSAKKVTARSPPANRRQPAAPRAQSTVSPSREDPNCSVSLGAMDEVPTAFAENMRTVPPEYDREAIATWEYPSNYEKREYQFAMVEAALFRNSLICLPTGLGKTLVAAVVMYNFYRWFPRGKIIFMAHNKPLVAQQIEACRDVVSIPASDSIAMTGKMSPETRAKHWTNKRIFFVTPQIPQNDILSGICPAEEVCLLVIDEAHKAHGDYAYCHVVRHIAKVNPYFRVMALTATPGADFASIQDVISNLLISKIELRTEDSPDVKPYLHTRVVEEASVKLEGPTLKARELLKAVISVPIVWLQSQQALYRTKKGDFFTFNRLEAARTDYRNNPNMQRKDEFFKSNVEARFATAMSLFHGSRLISDYGLGPFKQWLNEQTAKPVFEKTSRFFTELIHSKEWQTLVRFVNEDIGDASLCRHPKMTRLEGIILDHFHTVASQAEASLNINGVAEVNPPTGTSGTHGQDAKATPETRVMIFVQYRDTVEDIVRMLKNHEPFIRPMAFIGQSKKGLSQKQQGEVVQKFREGHFNTLVATSIGEEGLDIGEVDLIICYDSQQSPIRMIQRMGRTGRKRNGRCVMLLTAGGEDVTYKRSKVKGKTMIRTISNSSRFHFYNAAEPNHLLPSDVPLPKPVMCHMVPVRDQDDAAEKKVRKPRAKKATSAKRSGATTSVEDAMLQDENSNTDNHTNDGEERGAEAPTSWSNFDIQVESEHEDASDEIDQLLSDNEHNSYYSPFQSDAEEEEVEEVRAPSKPVETFNAPAPSNPRLNEPQPHHQVQAQPAYNPPQPKHVAPLHTAPQVVSSVALNFRAAAPSTTLTTPIMRREPSLNTVKRSMAVLNQSQSTFDSTESMQVPLDDFPLGFLEEPPRATDAAFIPPAPMLSQSTMNVDTNLIPPPPTFPTSIPPPPTVLDLPGQKPLTMDPPASNTMLFHTSASLASVASSAPASKVSQHTAPQAAHVNLPSTSTSTTTATAAEPKAKTSSRIIAEEGLSPPKRPSTAISSVSDLSSSILSAEDGNSPRSPQFRRLKRAKSAEEEEDLDDDCVEILSPPVAKRPCTKTSAGEKYFSSDKKRKNRFFDEEASLDLDNSDGEPSVERSGVRDDDVPDSQDIAFIASDGESDMSLTGMRAVYAKSLASPDKNGHGGTMKRKSSRGVGSLDWLDEGEVLQKKMAEWAAYSDVEASSEGNDASAYTVDSIDNASDLSTSIMAVPFSAAANPPKSSRQAAGPSNSQTDPVVISSPETSPKQPKSTISHIPTLSSSAQASGLSLGGARGNITRSTPNGPPSTHSASIPGPAFRAALSTQAAPSAPKLGAPVSLSLGKRSAPVVPQPSAPAPKPTRVTAAEVMDLLDGLDDEDLMAVDGVF